MPLRTFVTGIERVLNQALVSLAGAEGTGGLVETSDGRRETGAA